MRAEFILILNAGRLKQSVRNLNLESSASGISFARGIEAESPQPRISGRGLAADSPTRGCEGRAPTQRKPNKGGERTVLMLFNARDGWKREIIFVPLRSQNKV